MAKTNKKVRLKSDANVSEYSPTGQILDKAFVSEAILECLSNNDVDGVLEILADYFNILIKVKLANRASKVTLKNK